MRGVAAVSSAGILDDHSCWERCWLGATLRYSALSLVFPVVILLGLAACNPTLEQGASGADGKD